MFKKWDVILIFLLLILSFLPQLIFHSFTSNQNTTYAQITIHGKLYKEIPLSSHSGTEDITIQNKYGMNKIRIKDHTIEIIESDCKNQICVKQGSISSPGETIACLPHQLLIEIKSTSTKKQHIIRVG